MKNRKQIAVFIALIFASHAALAKHGDNWSESVSARVQEQVDAWRQGQTDLQPVDDGGILRYPYGSTPIVICATDHFCSVRLQAGEKINNVVLGDSVQWMAAPANTGSGDTLTPMVIIKPKVYGISTNMLITTTRHTYNLVLQSKKDEPHYNSEIGYYWPDEMVQQWSSAQDAQAAQEKKVADETVADLPPLTAANMHFDYSVTSKASDSSLNPVRIFDDGQHVYIQMPASMSTASAPALLAMDANGDTQIVNYRLKDGYYIVDRLFTKAELIVGVGDSQQKVVIEKASPRHSFW